MRIVLRGNGHVMLESLISYLPSEEMFPSWRDEDRFPLHQLTKESARKIYRYVDQHFLEASEDCFNHHGVTEVGRHPAFYTATDDHIHTVQHWLNQFHFDDSQVICIYQPHHVISVQWSDFVSTGMNFLRALLWFLGMNGGSWGITVSSLFLGS